MNEIVFTYDPNPLSHASIRWSELEAGLRRMHITENYDELRDVFRRYGLGSWIKNRENYQTLDAFSEDDIEDAITHETLHCVLFDLVGKEISMELNVLDIHPKFSRCLR